MMFKKNSHCSYCGAAFAEDQTWPRRCDACGNTTFQNPLPVAVVLLPVDGGLLLVRRAIPPHQGMLALPGGYINLGETWQAAGAREVLEETGIAIDPEEIRDFRVLSAPDGTVLIFGLARPRTSAELPAFALNEEASECAVRYAGDEIAFDLHRQVVQEFFGGRSDAAATP
jgi:ADP-ribose pyrophosphatase YjhB (NUDIX family)